MSDQDGEHESALLDERPAKPHPLLAWSVILLLAIAAVIFQRSRSLPDSGDQARVQARLVIGLSEWMPGSGKQLLKQLEVFEHGSIRDQLCVIVVTGELDDPRVALDRLISLELEARKSADQDELRLVQILRRLYTGYVNQKFTGVPDAADTAFVKQKLGWVGELALAPRQGDPVLREQAIEPARRLVMVLMGMAVGGCGLLVLGLTVLIVVLKGMYGAEGQRGFREGSPHGGFYVEAFAVWLILFSLLSLLGSRVVAGHSRLLLVSLLTLASLIALGWPVLRGVPWATVKQDIGLTAGQGLLVEAGNGLLCYLTCLPLVLVGLLLISMLIQVAKNTGLDRFLPTTPGGHPIASQVRGADTWQLVQIFLAASVFAPFLEEIVFRGLLYRHLREATREAGPGKSLLISALLGSFLFAVVHPQGILAVPALMSLAIGFSIWRERRGSLIACAVAHGIHNGLVLFLGMQVLR